MLSSLFAIKLFRQRCNIVPRFWELLNTSPVSNIFFLNNEGENVKDPQCIHMLSDVFVQEELENS